MDIVSAIDLNYILAEAKKERYNVSLTCGRLEDNIKWARFSRDLSFNYDIAFAILCKFVSSHSDKIIRLTVTSDDIFPLNRNMIIYVPYEIDINRVKKEYNSVVDLF